MSKQGWKRPPHMPPPRTAADSGVVVLADPVPDTAAQPREPELTVQTWTRGRSARDHLVKAFVHEHTRVRTVKRTAAAWAALYQEFLTQPRG